MILLIHDEKTEEKQKMKLFIASDIHGSEYYCRKMLEAYKKEGADKLILLGDVLYHGPRNDLPRDYAPKSVISMLNPLKKELLCVRGNCDTEVDQMVLDFPVLADYAVLFIDGVTIYATHGHVYNEAKLPPLCDGDILLHGHTHVPKCVEHNEKDGVKYIYMNPGSVSIPKEESHHGYMVVSGGVFEWKDVETGEVKLQYRIQR